MPDWVYDCIEQYRRNGLSEAEAKRRCYGAAQARKQDGALHLDQDRVTGLAIRFGSPAERDRVGQYFDARTELYLDQYIPGAPMANASPIGRMAAYHVQPGVGVWVTTQLTLPHGDPRYAPLVADLQAGRMRYSSDSIQQHRQPAHQPRRAHRGVAAGGAVARARRLRRRAAPAGAGGQGDGQGGQGRLRRGVESRSHFRSPDKEQSRASPG